MQYYFCFQDLFATVCILDKDRYFLCRMEEFKFLAETINHVPMDLKDKYVFCCAPIPRAVPFVATLFLKVCVKVNVKVKSRSALYILCADTSTISLHGYVIPQG